ncbi:hydrogenase iron-sulfur subunit [Desulfobacca acetoxidans]|uniref:Methyl-viologen-reducing hydrogenase delta subunit n=1 Tax=Desulfobacca acetoxidans (strain ATCC 700848 / DSM 11109 / ASRB2) TaxID=880072 RepID=F2NH63_DESAR|nr:hydrogenase iron-sulfur subunit [Desulfobacca acetoxidans]AEB08905.1 methyl-viologen-reducing hydrogenase delta subunit [Desulfobacca acetoxidans DSM 11109]HAY20663.1 hydrogenase iron-sulfur subunit [Desulfobacterales bacterium]
MKPITDLVILACTQAVPDPAALNQALEQRGLRGRIIQEPCSSKVEAFQLLRLLASGADMVWVIGCPVEHCLLVEGSTRMGFRVAHAQSYLTELGIESERLGFSRVSAGDPDGLAAAAGEIYEQAQALGPSPVRPQSKV